MIIDSTTLRGGRSLMRNVLHLSLSFLLFGGAVGFVEYDANRALARHKVSVTDPSVPMGDFVYDAALDVFKKADHVHYEHQFADAAQQVDFNESRHDALCDCSGFVCYVLHQVTPKHYESITSFDPPAQGHAQAKTFEHFFESLSATEPANGWIRLQSYKKLLRGDLIAWEKAPTPESLANPKKGNTGHVMIVESPPGETHSLTVQGADLHYVEVPVIDSSSVDHFPPEELPPHAHQDHRDGVGRGVVRLILDDQENACGYWEGTFWNEGGKKITKPSFPAKVSFARLMHEAK